MSSRIIEKETFIPQPLEKVFNFFSKAENLNILTPPNLKFKIITPLPIHMKKGTIIDYKLKLFNIPFNWRTEITVWDPPFRFIDTQVKGPYSIWIHEHIFDEIGNGTLMYDKVEYLSPGRFAEPLIHNLFVKKNLDEVFTFREKSISEIFKPD